jgi:hypothetical protein
MMFHLRAAQTTFLATGAALAVMTVAFGDYAQFPRVAALVAS